MMSTKMGHLTVLSLINVYLYQEDYYYCNYFKNQNENIFCEGMEEGGGVLVK